MVVLEHFEEPKGSGRVRQGDANEPRTTVFSVATPGSAVAYFSIKDHTGSRPEEHLDQRERIRHRVRGHVSTMRPGAFIESLLPPCMCDTVPLYGETRQVVVQRTPVSRDLSFPPSYIVGLVR